MLLAKWTEIGTVCECLCVGGCVCVYKAVMFTMLSPWRHFLRAEQVMLMLMLKYIKRPKFSASNILLNMLQFVHRRYEYLI